MTNHQTKTNNQVPNRRQMLGWLAGSGLLGGLVGNMAYQSFGGLNLALAQTSLVKDLTDSRLVVILLEGGLDGLAALIPYGDPDYITKRKELAMVNESAEPIGIMLNDFFCFHPVLARPLLPIWQEGHLALAPAMASPYRGDSHLDARLIMQTAGSKTPLDSGWLARALQELNPKLLYNQIPTQAELDGVAKPNQDRGPILGVTPTSLPFYTQYQKIIAADKGIKTAFDEMLFYQQQLQSILGSDHNPLFYDQLNAQHLPWLAAKAGAALANSNTWRVAVLGVNGFDSHFNQGTTAGILAQRLAAVGQALLVLRNSLDKHWDDTLIVVVTEFGRTIEPNRTHGTDHGLASLAMLMGGRVKGQKFLGEWPGIKASLDQGRGLQPSIDSRHLFRAIVKQQWNLPINILDKVFPEVTGVDDFPDLFHEKPKKDQSLQFL